VTPRIRYIVPTILLLVVGAALWTLGRLEQRLAESRRQLLTLQYEAPLEEYDRLEPSAAWAGRLPATASLLGDLHDQRATSHYWHRDYAAATLARDEAGGLTERDPYLLLVGANAAFRQIRLEGGDKATVQRLNAILEQYAEAMKQGAGFDAAYNYEFVVRARDAITKPRGDKSAAKPAVAQTIHGRPGAPPGPSQTKDFKIIVPQRSDERNQQPEAGSGAKKERRG
jgi:hypothetical protein